MYRKCTPNHSQNLMASKLDPSSHVLSVSSSEAHASRDHFFLSPDFHELRRSLMSICLFIKVKQQWATLVLGWVTAPVHYLCL